MRKFVRTLVGGAHWAVACGVLVACTQSHPVSGTVIDGPLGAGVGAGGGADGDAAIATPDAGAVDPGGNSTDMPGAGCVDCQGADLLGFVQFPPCCTSGNKCGLDFAALAGTPLCLERDAPGTADPSCPGAMLSMFSLPGCCRPDGTCGAMSTLVPLGCIGSEIADLLPGGGGGGGGGGNGSGNGAGQTCTTGPQ